jgi:hypothetical protein
MVATLLERQEAIASAYLDHGGGIDRFRVQGGTLQFVDLLERHGRAPGDVERQVTWHVFDNAAERTTRRLRVRTTARETISLPDASPPFLRVRIQTPERGTTFVYLRRMSGGAYEVVGREFESPERTETARAGK